MGNGIHSMYGFSKFANEIKYPNLRKVSGKFCTLDVRIVWICKNIEYPDLRKLQREIVYIRCTNRLNLPKN